MPYDADGTHYVTITVDDRPAPLCDFCSSPDLAWVYPAESFDLPRWRTGSVTNWGACETCAALVETGDKDALLQRSYQTAGLGETTDAWITDQCLAFLRDLHGGFYRYRSGPRWRFDAGHDRTPPATT